MGYRFSLPSFCYRVTDFHYLSDRFSLPSKYHSRLQYIVFPTLLYNKKLYANIELTKIEVFILLYGKGENSFYYC